MRAAAFCGVVTVIVVALAGPEPPDPGSMHGVAPLASMESDVAQALLDELPTVSLDRGVAYAREAFGPAWEDVDANGCSTRDDVLARDLDDVEIRRGSGGCVVIAGTLTDPYTGQRIAFRKAKAGEVQIDHLVPLHATWMLGAYRWTPRQRVAYANDPRVLLAVSGPANQDKGDQLADRWRPANRGAWCAYGVETVAVHHAYRLGVTASERAALEDLLATCPR